ncbi:MAG: AmmeMemoRadiSam system protein B [Anaerolineae bacterium]|nr:AmmeMemoRadiSam system protein B [Anaerolineae bacterium]
MAYTDVRPSAIAGTWYPGSRDRLAAMIDRFIAQAKVTPVSGEVVGLMAPHAGYRYSGQVAAHAFWFVQGKEVDTVIVFSPLHRVLTAAPVFTTGHQAYETPLGPIGVDHDAIDALRAAGVKVATLRHDDEHSLEIELPFLQRTLAGDFTLIPLMIGDQSSKTAAGLGRAAAKIVRDRRVLLVGSTDLSHFYDQTTARRLDDAVLERVAAFDPEGVIRVEAQGKGFACGRAAVAAAMEAARELGANAAVVTNYATSGDVSGDFDRVVGYGAAVFYRRA